MGKKNAFTKGSQALGYMDYHEEKEADQIFDSTENILEGMVFEVDGYDERLWEGTTTVAGTFEMTVMDQDAVKLAEYDDKEFEDLAERDKRVAGGGSNKRYGLGAQPTLLDVKRQAKQHQIDKENLEEMDAGPYGGGQRRVKITNFTSEDTVVNTRQLDTYFCRFCGDWIMITDVGKIGALPKRRYDGCIIIEEAKWMLRMNVNGSKRKVIVKRSPESEGNKGDGNLGIAKGLMKSSSSSSSSKDSSKAKDSSKEEMGEQQYRFQCKGCGGLVGYREEPLGETARATYIYPDTLVDTQTNAMAIVNGIAM